MSSTINATTVGVGGVVTTADNSGILVLQTASTDAVTISAAQGVTLAGTLGVTGITTVAAGTAALPSIISTTGTADTGQWFPAADTIAYSTAGSERMRIDSSGNVGISTTSPSTWGKFAVVGASSGGQVVASIVNTSGTANTQAVLSFDTTNNGFNSRDSQIRATNNGSNQTTLEFYTANAATPAERMRIDSSGRVGIGCTPARQLSVQYPFAKTDTTSRAITVFKSNDASNANEMLFSSVGAATQASRVWKIQTGEDGVSNAGSISLQPDGGNVGIGTTSVSYKLHVRTSAVTGLAGFTYTPQIVTESNATGGFGMHTPTANQGVIAHSTPLDQTSAAIHFDGASRYMSFATVNDTERMRIDSSGNLLVGTTTGTNTSGVAIGKGGAAGGGIVSLLKTASGVTNGLLNYYQTTYVGGINFDNTSTSFPTSSDERLKKDILDSVSAKQKIESIRIVSHGWKHDEAVVDFGIIAQELYEIFPRAVSKGDDEDEIQTIWSVDYSKLVPLLIKASQEQQAIIETLTARITALETL